MRALALCPAVAALLLALSSGSADSTSVDYGAISHSGLRVSCCSAAKGFDLASGLGSPLANEIVKHLHH